MSLCENAEGFCIFSLVRPDMYWAGFSQVTFTLLELMMSMKIKIYIYNIYIYIIYIIYRYINSQSICTLSIFFDNLYLLHIVYTLVHALSVETCFLFVFLLFVH